MKNIFKNYFNYSNSERKGTVALLILLLLALLGYWIIDFVKKDSSTNFSNLSDEVQRFMVEDSLSALPVKKIVYFPFNPNEINKEAWQQLGFSDKQAQSIIKYREKGGYFYKKEDLKRLYVVNDSIYDLLYPYVLIKNKVKVSAQIERCYFVELVKDSVPIYSGFSGLNKVICNRKDGIYTYYIGSFSSEASALESQKKVKSLGFANTLVVKLPCNTGFVINKKAENKKTIETKFNAKQSSSLRSKMEMTTIDINLADTTAYKTLKGIGSYYSGKIVKYREALGGFHDIEQLKEVYGLKPEVVDQNRDRLIISTIEIRKININTCESSDLKKHPYINWNIANSIVQVRKSHAPYKTIEGIKKSDLVNEEIYRKIAPYLKIE